MAFIVPVIRKDYNLYPTVMISANCHQQTQRNKVQAKHIKEARLTKSLSLFPTLTNTRGKRGNPQRVTYSSKEVHLKLHELHDLHKLQANESIDSSAPMLQCSTLPPDSKLASVTENLANGAMTDMLPLLWNEFKISSPSSDDRIQKASEETKHKNEMNNNNFSSTDPGYFTSSETPSPSSFLSSNETNFSSLMSISAPTSPSLGRATTAATRAKEASRSCLSHNARPLRCASEETNETENHMMPIESTPRHVHFGFCEQIEYDVSVDEDGVDDQENKDDSHSKTKRDNKLRRLERKLAAQLRNTLLFRPPAHSLPAAIAPLQNNALLKPSAIAQGRVSTVPLKAAVESKKLSVDDYLGYYFDDDNASSL